MLKFTFILEFIFLKIFYASDDFMIQVVNDLYNYNPNFISETSHFLTEYTEYNDKQYNYIITSNEKNNVSYKNDDSINKIDTELECPYNLKDLNNSINENKRKNTDDINILYDGDRNTKNFEPKNNCVADISQNLNYFKYFIEKDQDFFNSNDKIFYENSLNNTIKNYFTELKSNENLKVVIAIASPFYAFLNIKDDVFDYSIMHRNDKPEVIKNLNALFQILKNATNLLKKCKNDLQGNNLKKFYALKLEFYELISKILNVFGIKRQIIAILMDKIKNQLILYNRNINYNSKRNAERKYVHIKKYIVFLSSLNFQSYTIFTEQFFISCNKNFVNLFKGKELYEKIENNFSISFLLKKSMLIYELFFLDFAFSFYNFADQLIHFIANFKVNSTNLPEKNNFKTYFIKILIEILKQNDPLNFFIVNIKNENKDFMENIMFKNLFLFCELIATYDYKKILFNLEDEMIIVISVSILNLQKIKGKNIFVPTDYLTNLHKNLVNVCSEISNNIYKYIYY